MRYGQKGGDGPNRGKKSAVYKAIAPDGSVLKKRTFHVSGSTALMSIYQHAGTWYISAVHDRETAPSWFFDEKRHPPIECIRMD